MKDKSSWAMGGGTMLGIGAGFFFIQISTLAFVGCTMAGIGIGLFSAAYM